MRILLVEDDPLLGEGLKDGFTDAGYTAEWLGDGEAARAAFAGGEHFDLLVLDLGLPRLDGIALLQTLRRNGERLPVLILTARDAPDERVRGLDAGADDYLVKPFVLDELLARVRALLRRAQGRVENVLRWRDLELDPVGHTVTRAGAPLELTAMEFRVLHLLLAAQPQVLSRAQFEERLYGWDGEAESNTLEVYLSRLRRKLGPTAIENIRGLGWRLAP